MFPHKFTIIIRNSKFGVCFFDCLKNVWATSVYAVIQPKLGEKWVRDESLSFQGNDGKQKIKRNFCD